MEYGNGQSNELVWKSSDNRYHNDDFFVNEDNVNVNVSMLSKYVQDQDKILDIGCGEGKFGAVIQSKECEIYGVDLDGVAADIAIKKNKYKNVFLFNIESPDAMSEDFKTLQAEKIVFDKIALIDVLEHVINPTQVIYNTIGFLKDEGKILVSVPNVNNADILLNLMRDHFNYRQAGVLDNTHTKYFTKKSFVEWIDEINNCNNFSLDCEYIGSTYAYTDFLQKIKVEKPYVYNWIQLNPYFHVMQHLFVLTLFRNRNDYKLTHLPQLLKEKEVDLIDELEKALQPDGKNQGSKDAVFILPNERKILEEQISSSNEGWKKCASELENAKNRIALQEAELIKAQSFAEKQQKDIEVLVNDNTNSFDKNKNTIEKWTECAKSLEELEIKLKTVESFAFKQEKDIELLIKDNIELTDKNKIIVDKWRECAEALEMALKRQTLEE